MHSWGWKTLISWPLFFLHKILIHVFVFVFFFETWTSEYLSTHNILLDFLVRHYLHSCLILRMSYHIFPSQLNWDLTFIIFTEPQSVPRLPIATKSSTLITVIKSCFKGSIVSKASALFKIIIWLFYFSPVESIIFRRWR